MKQDQNQSDLLHIAAFQENRDGEADGKSEGSSMQEGVLYAHPAQQYASLITYPSFFYSYSQSGCSSLIQLIDRGIPTQLAQPHDLFQ
jgi:hypothetical protein